MSMCIRLLNGLCVCAVCTWLCVLGCVYLVVCVLVVESQCSGEMGLDKVVGCGGVGDR